MTRRAAGARPGPPHGSRREKAMNGVEKRGPRPPSYTEGGARGWLALLRGAGTDADTSTAQAEES